MLEVAIVRLSRLNFSTESWKLTFATGDCLSPSASLILEPIDFLFGLCVLGGGVCSFYFNYQYISLELPVYNIRNRRNAVGSLSH